MKVYINGVEVRGFPVKVTNEVKIKKNHGHVVSEPSA